MQFLCLLEPNKAIQGYVMLSESIRFASTSRLHWTN